MTLDVLAVASEMFPLVKTGGLADVVGALPAALRGEGVRVTTLVPGYPSVTDALPSAHLVHVYDDFFGGPARVIGGEANQARVLALDAPHLFRRPGLPYSGPDGRDWPDNAFRFAALARAAADIGSGTTSLPRPQVVHAHDWQAGLTPAYLHYDQTERPGAVMTIHNLAFQGQFPADLLADLKLPRDAFSIDGVESYGGIGFLKAGLYFADAITTVSPTYAQEIQRPAAGMGLHGLLQTRARALHGILNGVDTTTWNPSHDPHLPVAFQGDIEAFKAASKTALQGRFGLALDPEALLCGVISRLSWQKGLDLVLELIPTILSGGGQLIVLGAGDPNLQDGFRAWAQTHPHQIGCLIGYDEGLAHQIQAGCDALFVPSRFEPCGLTQLCALRYGAIPVGASVGGLADTIIDANAAAMRAGVATGVLMRSIDQPGLAGAFSRLRALFDDPRAWGLMRRNAMASDVTWTQSAKQYAALYREVARGARR